MLNKLKAFFNDKEQLMQFIKYIFVGSSSFCGEYLIFNLIYNISKNNTYKVGSFTLTGALLANSISIFIAFWYCFILNRIWSFKSKGNIGRQLAYYSVLFIFNLFISNTVIHQLEIWFMISPRISKLFAMGGLIVCWNFLIYKFIIYKE